MEDQPTRTTPRGLAAVADRFRGLPHDWQLVLVGAAAAPGLVLVGLLVGLIEGGLLPGACRGLACLYLGLVLGYAGVVAGVWAVVALVVHLTRRRWPTAAARTWVLRVLAALGWAIPLLPVAVAFS